MTYLIAALVAAAVTSPLIVVGVWFWVGMAALAFLGFVIGMIVGGDDRPRRRRST